MREKCKLLFGVIKDIKKAGCGNFLGLFLSFLICRFYHGASLDNFRSLRMYEYTNRKRREVLTFKRQKVISDTLNAKASAEELNMLMNKMLFNRHFSSFIKREWLYLAGESEFLNIEKFIRENPKFFVKPIKSKQGKNI